VQHEQPDGNRNVSACKDRSEVVRRGLSGEPLNGEWNTWIEIPRDYVRSVYKRSEKVPQRVILTNGDWLIFFFDPSDAFLEGGSIDPNRILLFRNRPAMEDRYTELFRHLEHEQVSGEAPPFVPGELLFYLAPDAVEGAMHGLHLRYVEQQGIYRAAPVIKVAPVVFLRSRHGVWLRVESPPPGFMNCPTETVVFLDILVRFAKRRRICFQKRLNKSTTLCRFLLFRNTMWKRTASRRSQACASAGGDEFIVATGDETHYLLAEPLLAILPTRIGVLATKWVQRAILHRLQCGRWRGKGPCEPSGP